MNTLRLPEAGDLPLESQTVMSYYLGNQWCNEKVGVKMKNSNTIVCMYTFEYIGMLGKGDDTVMRKGRYYLFWEKGIKPMEAFSLNSVLLLCWTQKILVVGHNSMHCRMFCSILWYCSVATLFSPMLYSWWVSSDFAKYSLKCKISLGYESLFWV